MPPRNSMPPVSAATLLSSAGVDALLVSHLTNIRYLTGLQLSAGFLLARRSGFTLFVDARYSENARAMLRGRMRICDIDALPSALKALPVCGVESEHVTLEKYRKWKTSFKSTKFVQTVGILAQARRVKAAHELQAIRTACRITRKVLSDIPSFLRPGLSERQLAWRITEACHRLGAEGMAFDTIVAFGAHTARPHHRPTDAVVRKGDLVQIDMGAAWGGYCSDFSRVYFTGEPTRLQRQTYDVLSRVQRSMMRRTKAGITNRQLDALAREQLGRHGFTTADFPHALGHGVGLDIHDGIVLSGKAPEVTLQKNEVVTIEPGLYFPGKWGMRIEDTVIVV